MVFKLWLATKIFRINGHFSPYFAIFYNMKKWWQSLLINYYSLEDDVYNPNFRDLLL
jgi:hypothetical protein